MSSLLLVHLAECGLSVLTADEIREERDTVESEFMLDWPIMLIRLRMLPQLTESVILERGQHRHRSEIHHHPRGIMVSSPEDGNALLVVFVSPFRNRGVTEFAVDNLRVASFGSG